MTIAVIPNCTQHNLLHWLTWVHGCLKGLW